ncbi:unnamed protein product [Polarella glacialis]|uniref:cGMP-dependent protein kinase n=1 Tax=Polarella glacialis TaxID=89957 RepID=A0A813L446_POLGL|nr:unnamed protein product [Polarella glacialis]
MDAERSLRDRIATPFLSYSQSSSKTVQFSDPAAIEVSGTLSAERICRDRVATPFMSSDALQHWTADQGVDADTRTVSFQQHADTDVVEISPVGEMRPIRRNSGDKSFRSAAAETKADTEVVEISLVGEMEPLKRNSGDKGVRFAAADSIAESASIASPNSRPSVRGRTPTGYVDAGAFPGQMSTEVATVSFAAGETVLEFDPGSVFTSRTSFTPTGFSHSDGSTSDGGVDTPPLCRKSTSHRVGDNPPLTLNGSFRNRLSETEIGSIRLAAVAGAKAAAKLAAAEAAKSKKQRQGVSFSAGEECIVEPGSTAETGGSRSIRERKPKGFARDPDDLAKAVSFAAGESVVPAASSPAHGAASNLRDRTPTGFIHMKDLAAASGGGSDSSPASPVGGTRTVTFRQCLSLVEFDDFSEECSVPQDERSVRFMDREAEPVAAREDQGIASADSAPLMNLAAESDSQSGSRSSSAGAKRRHPRRDAPDSGDNVSDAETVSSASSRNPRSRMNTPFMSAASWGYEVGVPPTSEAPSEGSAAGSTGRSLRRHSKGFSGTMDSSVVSSGSERNLIKQVSMESKIEREICERVRLNAQRQAREERCEHLGCDVPPMGLTLQRVASVDGGNPEAYLDNRIVSGAVKDSALLRNTLRKLTFFETFDDHALHALIDAMDVYEFQDGDKAVRQGDTDGTHFFVVAEGEFYVVRDGVKRCYIGPGGSFGESVLLLFGERNATVCAQGRARAYGLEGMAVRDLLRDQYEQRREHVIQAVDEVLSSDKCDILSRLNAYQLQSLYDQVEMQSFEKGATITREGPGELTEVLVLLKGVVSMSAQGVKLGILPQYMLIGDRSLVFKEQPTTLVVEQGHAEVLVLKRSLLDTIFGDSLPHVLMKNRLLYVLGQHVVCSRLHEEQREAVASRYQIQTLCPGSECDLEDVRLVSCLQGEVEMYLLEDDQESPQIRRFSGAVTSIFGEENLGRDKPLTLRVRALVASSLAIWRSQELDRILAFNDLDFALEQDDKVRGLQSTFIFSTLSKQQLQRLAKALDTQLVRAGERIFSQGDQGTHFYIIRSGLVLVEIDGRKIRTQGIGDYFGERALLYSEQRSASVTVAEDGELWKMDKETFQEILGGMGPCLDYLTARVSLQDTNLTFEDLEYIRVIGRGGFGVVKMVRAKRTHVRYALKCVRKKDVVVKGVQDALVSERSIMAEVDHPFIIKFVRSFCNKSRVYFLMELVSGGELLDVLDTIGLLKHPQAMFYTASILLALEFLHARRIAYLDLKSENCLIDHQGFLKLIDFGIARRITSTRYGPLKGTPMFMAPEMILGKGHTTVADLWSLGVCLYEFVVGEFPFAKGCKNHGQIFHEILRAELHFPSWLLNGDKQSRSEAIISLIRALLTRDPKKRLGAGVEGYITLKAHPFFHGLCWEKLLGREVKPPFVPIKETYAEDKEDALSGKSSMDDELPSVADEEAECERLDDDRWEDPEPGWDADF